MPPSCCSGVENGKNTKPILYEFDKNMNVICRKVLEPSTVKKE